MLGSGAPFFAGACFVRSLILLNGTIVFVVLGVLRWKYRLGGLLSHFPGFANGTVFRRKYKLCRKRFIGTIVREKTQALQTRDPRGRNGAEALLGKTGGEKGGEREG